MTLGGQIRLVALVATLLAIGAIAQAQPRAPVREISRSVASDTGLQSSGIAITMGIENLRLLGRNYGWYWLCPRFSRIPGPSRFLLSRSGITSTPCRVTSARS